MPSSDTYLTLTEVAKANGVQKSSVRGWLKRNNLYKTPFVFIRKIKNVPVCKIRIDAAERYSKGRLSSRPKDSVTLKGVLKDLNVVPKSTATNKLLKGIKTPMYRSCAYIKREDVELLKRRIQKSKVPLGFIPVIEAAKKAKVSRQSIMEWAKKYTIETVKRGSVRYIHHKDVKAYSELFRNQKRVDGRKKAEAKRKCQKNVIT